MLKENTMLKEITLIQYLEMGGKLDKVDWGQAYCEKNNNKIISCLDLGETNSYGEKLVNLTFENGETKRYAIMWIKVFVKVTMDEKYF